MSFRTSNRPPATSIHAPSDQSSRAGVTKRTSDAMSSGTNSPRRSTIFRISASLNPASNDLDSTTNSTTAYSPLQAQQGLQRAGTSGLAQTGMSVEDAGREEILQNGSSRPFLQTRRRQPSTNTARAPLGPRPVEAHNSESSRSVKVISKLCSRLTLFSDSTTSLLHLRTTPEQLLQSQFKIPLTRSSLS